MMVSFCTTRLGVRSAGGWPEGEVRLAGGATAGEKGVFRCLLKARE